MLLLKAAAISGFAAKYCCAFTAMIFPYRSPVLVEGKALPNPQIILTAPPAPAPVP
jgi:hypothetical protein